LRIQLSDATLTDELVDFFRRRACRVEQVNSDVIEVEAHPTLGPGAGAAWRGILNP